MVAFPGESHGASDDDIARCAQGVISGFLPSASDEDTQPDHRIPGWDHNGHSDQSLWLRFHDAASLMRWSEVLQRELPEARRWQGREVARDGLPEGTRGYELHGVSFRDAAGFLYGPKQIFLTWSQRSQEWRLRHFIEGQGWRSTPLGQVEMRYDLSPRMASGVSGLVAAGEVPPGNPAVLRGRPRQFRSWPQLLRYLYGVPEWSGTLLQSTPDYLALPPMRYRLRGQEVEGTILLLRNGQERTRATVQIVATPDGSRARAFFVETLPLSEIEILGPATRSALSDEVRLPEGVWIPTRRFSEQEGDEIGYFENAYGRVGPHESMRYVSLPSSVEVRSNETDSVDAGAVGRTMVGARVSMMLSARSLEERVPARIVRISRHEGHLKVEVELANRSRRFLTDDEIRHCRASDSSRDFFAIRDQRQGPPAPGSGQIMRPKPAGELDWHALRELERSSERVMVLNEQAERELRSLGVTFELQIGGANRHRVRSHLLEFASLRNQLEQAALSNQTLMNLHGVINRVNVYRVKRLPPGIGAPRYDTPAFIHPEMEAFFRSLQEMGIRIDVDPTLGLSGAGAYFSASQRTIILDPSAPWHHFRHEALHAMMSHFHVRSTYQRMLQMVRRHQNPAFLLDEETRRSWIQARIPVDLLLNCARREIPYNAANETLATEIQMQLMRDNGQDEQNPQYRRTKLYGLRWQIYELDQHAERDRTYGENQTYREALRERDRLLQLEMPGIMPVVRPGGDQGRIEPSSHER